MTAPDPHPLVAAYLDQRQALARFCRARLGPAGEVEDVLQDIYLRVAALDAGTEVQNPSAYLYRLATNVMADRFRSARRSGARDAAWRLSHHAVGLVEDLDDAPSAEAVVAGRERLARLLAALSALPTKTQTIFRRHKFDGTSYADIAVQLGISRSSVEKHMMDALRALAVEARA